MTVFFRNFVLFSEARCEMLLNALTKVIYSILRAKFGIKSNIQPKKLKVEKVQAKDVKKGKGGRKKKHYDTIPTDLV